MSRAMKSCKKRIFTPWLVGVDTVAHKQGRPTPNVDRPTRTGRKDKNLFGDDLGDNIDDRGDNLSGLRTFLRNLFTQKFLGVYENTASVFNCEMQMWPSAGRARVPRQSDYFAFLDTLPIRHIKFR